MVDNLQEQIASLEDYWHCVSKVDLHYMDSLEVPKVYSNKNILKSIRIVYNTILTKVDIII